MVQPFSSVRVLPRDLRYGLRKMNNDAGFTAVAVICLALGICASVTVFSVVDSLLLRPLPGVMEQGRIVSLAGKTHSLAGAGEIYESLSYPSFLRYREASRAFSDLVAIFPVAANLTSRDDPRRVQGQVVSDNYFRALGMKPSVGRLLSPGEGARSAVPGVVVSHALWQRSPGLKAQGVGSIVGLNGKAFVLLGVAPEGFRGTLHSDPSDFWIPIEVAPRVVSWLRSGTVHAPKPAWLLLFFGRLAPGVDLKRAQTELDLVADRLNQGVPAEEKTASLVVYPGLGTWPGTEGKLAGPLVLASVLVGLLMLVVCANLGSLLMVKAAARQEEIGVRLVLGVTRGRLVRQLLTESLVLALLGGAAGFVLALFVIESIEGLRLGPRLPEIYDLRADGRVVAFTLGLSLVTGVLFGLVPALWSTRRELRPLLHPGSGSGLLDGGRTRLQEVFVVGQVTISLVLLVSAGLFVRTLLNLSSIDPGFESAQVLDLRINLSLGNYSDVQGQAFYDELLARVRKLPGVSSAALTLTVPLGQNNAMGLLQGVWPEADAGDKEPLVVDCSVISPGYFDTLGIPLLRGRDFTAEDRRGAPGVAIVDEQLAAILWPNKNPLDEHLVLAPDKKALEVVGVVRNVRVEERETTQPYFYLPLAQRYQPDLALEVKGEDPLRLVGPIRGIVKQLDRNLAVEAGGLDGEVQTTLAQPRLFSWLLGSFSLVAVLVTAIGLYGTLSYTVSRRTRELGIRMALGARASEIVALVMRRGLTLTLTGLTLGLVASSWTTSVFSNLLFGVTPTDPGIFISVALLLALVGLAASSLPAYSATRVDPMAVIRHE